MSWKQDCHRSSDADDELFTLFELGPQEVVMSTNTKVSALDHAMHTAHTWINDVAREFDTGDRKFAYGVAARPD